MKTKDPKHKHNKLIETKKLDKYVSHKEVGKALEEIAEGKVSVLEK